MSSIKWLGRGCLSRSIHPAAPQFYSPSRVPAALPFEVILMAFISNTPMLSLTSMSGSFPFQTKYLPLVRNSKIMLGSEPPTGSGAKPAASTSNGWFSSGSSGSIAPLPVSSSHAEVWWDGRQICIRDLDSAFGTFVNDVKIKDTTVLKTGDIVSLGVQISRNRNTPTYITDDQLKPITAKVALAGVAS